MAICFIWIQLRGACVEEKEKENTGVSSPSSRCWQACGCCDHHGSRTIVGETQRGQPQKHLPGCHCLLITEEPLWHTREEEEEAGGREEEGEKPSCKILATNKF